MKHPLYINKAYFLVVQEESHNNSNISIEEPTRLINSFDSRSEAVVEVQITRITCFPHIAIFLVTQLIFAIKHERSNFNKPSS